MDCVDSVPFRATNSVFTKITMTTTTQTEVCPECNGYGNFIWDGYDHRGEHTQHVSKCLDCDGTGEVD